MKKLINDPRRVVREMLEGLADTTPGIALLDEENVVIRANLPEPAARPVAVISGGGAGHEPAHAGYVGAGMLHAAVVGDVFTSPSVDAVLAAIQAVGGPAGVVLVVKNYTGDRLNFGLAAELARAAGIPAEIVVVADDVALRDTVAPSRRRGIAGTVLIHKIAGAVAEAGGTLHDVAEAARQAAAALGSMGVALGACTVPAAGTPGFALAEDEIELGLGIHGEPGVRRAKIQPVDRLVHDMLDVIVEDRGMAAGHRVALLVNGLGGTPPMELAVVARAAMAGLRARGIVVARAWTGTLLSALEMPGVSLSLLTVDDARVAHLDAATAAPAWPGPGLVPAQRATARSEAQRLLAGQHHTSDDTRGSAVLAGALACAAALEDQEKQLTELDAAVGDGDLGISMTRGAAAIRAISQQPVADAASALTLIADALRRAIGGSSGPFYAVGLLRAAEHLASGAGSGPAFWAEAFEHGVAAIAELGGAQRGDCTMLDALYPAVDALKAGLQRNVPLAEAWRQCVAAAEQGAASTASMRPRLGRAAYLGDRAVGQPDGGAVAVSIWLRALTPVIK
ncbi:MAG: dihydroxyacetone kinase subunit DhaK [Proteobacteria bacterium]|nr:dihydroxyacetone kinase subunit DhaK [Pseudomonadota bacterium]